MNYDIYRLTGRRSSGGSLDGGKLYHAVPHGSYTAICGKKPSKSSDWSAYPGTIVTCPRCLVRLAAGQPEQEEEEKPVLVQPGDLAPEQDILVWDLKKEKNKVWGLLPGGAAKNALFFVA